MFMYVRMAARSRACASAGIMGGWIPHTRKMLASIVMLGATVISALPSAKTTDEPGIATRKEALRKRNAMAIDADKKGACAEELFANSTLFRNDVATTSL